MLSQVDLDGDPAELIRGSAGLTLMPLHSLAFGSRLVVSMFPSLRWGKGGANCVRLTEKRTPWVGPLTKYVAHAHKVRLPRVSNCFASCAIFAVLLARS